MRNKRKRNLPRGFQDRKDDLGARWRCKRDRMAGVPAMHMATNWQQLPMVNWNSKRPWNLTEEAGRESLASLLDWAHYPSESAAAHLLHYDSVVRQHMGPPPDTNNLLPLFKSHVTDDHTPIEFSLCWRESMMAPDVRYSIEPLASSAAQLRSDPVGANLLAAASLMEATCGQDGQDHITRLLCSDKMISHGQHRHQHHRQAEEDDIYSQTFLAWECLKDGGRPRIAKAYSLPFVLSRELRTPGIALLERMVVGTPYAAPLATIVSYMASLPAHLRPSFRFVCSDVLPAGSRKLNRLKAYFRLRSSHFPHILQVLGLGRELPPGQAQVYADLWECTTGSPPPHRRGAANGTVNAAAACDEERHPVVYFDLAPASADDVQGSIVMRSSKLYIPVRHLAPHDDVVACGLERFLERQGYQGWQGYRDAIARTFAHRPLAARAGVHTYVGCHFKKPGAAMPEITPYLSPEVYAPERYL